jgi:hypothetical protein
VTSDDRWGIGGATGPWAEKLAFVDREVRTQVSAGAASFPLDVFAQQNGTTALLVSYDKDGKANWPPTLGQIASVTFPLPATIRIWAGGTIPIQIP